MMQLLKPFFQQYSKVIFLWITVCCSPVSVCLGQSSSESPQPIEAQMKELNRQLQQLQAANKNKDALDVQHQIAKLYLSHFRSSIEYELKAVQDSFQAKSKSRTEHLAEIRHTTNEVSNHIASLKSGKSGLNSVLILLFGSLLAISAFIIFSRRRTLGELRQHDADAGNMIGHLEKLIHSKNNFLSENKITSSHQIFNTVLTNFGEFERLGAEKQLAESRTARQLLEDLQQANRIIDINNEVQEEALKKVNLNDLVRDAFALAASEFRNHHDLFEYDYVKDLEEILPEHEVYPEALRSALFFLFYYSLESVKDQAANAVKGYVPRITVSSRKLPRYIQIRIKDNGNRDISTLLQSAVKLKDNVNFNTHSLGIHLVNKVIVQQHKGELLFETDAESQHNIMIRFQTHSLN